MKVSKISCRLRFDEDFHHGSGFGKIGLYDDGQQKSPDEKPILSEDMLKGILRESCRQLELMKKSWGDNSCENLTNRIFADFSNLASLDVLISPFKSPAEPLNIQTMNSVIRENSLRAIECGSVGHEYNLTLHYQDMQPETDGEVSPVEFLKNGLLFTKTLAGDRKRGLGAFSFIGEIKTETVEIHPSHSEVSGNVLTLIFELKQDTLIGSRGQSGNLLFTSDYVNGAGILGMLRNPLLSMQLPREYLDEGRIESSFFYPLPPDWEPGQAIPEILPAFLSLRRKKKGGGKSVTGLPSWILAGKTGDRLKDIVSQDTIQPISRQDVTGDKGIYSGYIAYDPGQPKQSPYYEPALTYHSRNRIEPQKQATGVDGLFIEERIASGTRYAGYLRFKDKTDCQKFVDDLSPWLTQQLYLHTGRGSRPVEVVDWTTSPAEKKAKPVLAGNEFTVTLLSDCILTDDRSLRQLTGIPGEKMTGLLKGCTAILQRSVARHGVVTSYSGTSGLRRFRDVFIRKGSVFSFKCSNSEKVSDLSKKLTELQNRGLGLRRGEGFGKIAINHPLHYLDWKEPRDADEDQTVVIEHSINLKAQAFQDLYMAAEKLKLDLEKKLKSKHGWKRFAANLVVQFEFGDFSSCLQYLQKIQTKKQAKWETEDPRRILTESLISEMNSLSNHEFKHISLAMRMLEQGGADEA